MGGLPPFPAPTGTGPATPPTLVARGFALRAAMPTDLPALRRLHADTRADEMACVPWPAGLKQSFLDQQFDLQHTHYLQHYGDADFLVVERDGEVLGRLYLQRKAPEHLVVDISLLASTLISERTWLWTADRRLEALATELGKAYRPPLHA